jgi:hypothetical protein
MAKDPRQQLRERLKLEERRRARRPHVAPVIPTEISRGRAQRMIQEQSGLLMAVEMGIQQIFHQSGAFRDEHAAAALVAAIRDETASLTDPQAVRCAELVSRIRQDHPQLDPEVWRDCLRTILDSIRYHGGHSQSPTAYLDFVAMMMNRK